MTGARAEPHKQHGQSPDLGDRAEGLKVGGKLLHSLKQACRLGILPPLDSPLQLVCTVHTCWPLVSPSSLICHPPNGAPASSQLQHSVCTQQQVPGSDALTARSAPHKLAHSSRQHGTAAQDGSGA